MSRNKDPNKVALILSATRELIQNTQSFDFSMADVARKAGLATGTIYIYFENKEQLFNTLYRNIVEDILGQMSKELKPNQGFFANFKSLWYSHINFCFEQYPSVEMFDRFRQTDTLDSPSYKHLVQKLNPILDIFRTAQSQFLIKSIDAQLLLESMWATNKTIAYFYRATQASPDQSQLDLLFEMAWNAVRR